MPTFAFFDLDHTLLPFDTQTLFCNYVLQEERWRTLLHGAFIPVALLRAVKLVPTVTAKRAFLSYLIGMSEAELQGHARHFAEEEVRPWIYPELLAIIEEHRAAGRTLILNTASPSFYAREIARVLGFDHCIATQVTVKDPMPYLPPVEGPNNKRQAKIAAMRSQIPAVAAASAADLEASYAYSDSAADLPLLELAGHGVLVHPNPSLQAIGTAKGWKTIYPQRPYHSTWGDRAASVSQMFGLYRQRPASRTCKG